VRVFVSGQEAITREEFASLALGVEEELFFAELFSAARLPGEEDEAYTARLDAAADIARQDPTAAAYAAELLRIAPRVLSRKPAARRPARTEVAA
jgi:hypothetical protein